MIRNMCACVEIFRAVIKTGPIHDAQESAFWWDGWMVALILLLCYVFSLVRALNSDRCYWWRNGHVVSNC